VNLAGVAVATPCLSASATVTAPAPTCYIGGTTTSATAYRDSSANTTNCASAVVSGSGYYKFNTSYAVAYNSTMTCVCSTTTPNK
jgi:hypothetical protein